MKKLILTLFALLMCVNLYASVIYVTPTGLDANNGSSWATAKLTVTAAVTASVSGDQIWVKAGTYSETARINMKAGVSIYGGFAGTETALNERPAFPRTQPDSNESVLNGQNFTDCVVYAPSGVTTSDLLDGFTITGGEGYLLSGYRYGGGICCNGGSPAISNNRIVNNSSTYGGGIFSFNSSNPVIFNNVITGNNTSGNSGGIYTYSSTIQNNTVLNNTSVAGAGIVIGGYTQSFNISNNTISGNNASSYGAGIYCTPSTVGQINNNTITQNSAVIDAGGLKLYNCANIVVSNNIITYNTVTRTEQNCTGGGMTINDATILVSSNDISHNSVSAPVDSGGGGIYLGSGTAIVTIESNTISYNTARTGAGIRSETAPYTIQNNTISNNTASYNGGAAQLYGASVGIFKDNIVCSNIVSTNCGSGILSASQTSDSIYANNLFYSNSGTYGGALCIYNSSPKIINNTFVDNNGVNRGGALDIMGTCNSSISNNIVAFNNYGIYASSSSTPTLNYNNFYSNTGSNYNPTSLSHPTDISSDPLFVDYSGGDYHLTFNSPCKNAGSNTYVQTGWLDIDGQDRIVDTTVDIGADEVYKVSTPTFSPVAGNYNSAQTVSITSSTSGASIYYTLDGTTPTDQSTLYTTAITVSSSMTIKAIAYKTNYIASDVATADYVIDTIAPTPGTAACSSYSTSSPITISYSGASDTGGSGLEKVELWYKKGLNGTWTDSTLTSSTASGSFSFTVSGNWGTYYFDLVAEDNAGNRSATASGYGDCSTIYTYGASTCTFSSIIIPPAP